jgi:hypothetical protein
VRSALDVRQGRDHPAPRHGQPQLEALRPQIVVLQGARRLQLQAPRHHAADEPQRHRAPRRRVDDHGVGGAHRGQPRADLGGRAGRGEHAGVAVQRRSGIIHHDHVGPAGAQALEQVGSPALVAGHQHHAAPVQRACHHDVTPPSKPIAWPIM